MIGTMADGENDGRRPGLTARGKAREAARQERLSKALRDNLARRKAQARARQDAAENGDDGSEREPD